MAWHLYIVPAVGDGAKSDPRRPKYIDTLAVTWVAMDYGFQPIFMAAADLTTLQDTTLAANADVQKIPDNLDASPSPAGVTATQNFLESIHIPAGWVTTSLTWRQIVRTVAGLFQFMQRLKGFLGTSRLIDGGTVTLETRFNQLSAAARQALIDTATSFGYDTSSLGGASTLRQILKVMADQWGAAPIVVGGITL